MSVAIVAPGVIDARRCLSWTLQADGPFPVELRRPLGDRFYGCDDCQLVCPPNRRTDPAAPPASADAEAFVDVLEVLESTDVELLERFGRWYLPERNTRTLRRNALLVLANVGAPATDVRRVDAVLERALCHSDDIVRSTAVWAARRCGRDHLITQHPTLHDDGSPLVAAELERRLP